MREFTDGRLRARLQRSARLIIATVTATTAVAAFAVSTLVGTATAATSTDSNVAAGYAHTCAIPSDGTLWCWGDNASGQLGDGTTTNRATAARVGDATTWATIDAGTSDTCGIQTDGTLWCWGGNTSGQLGDGTTTNRTAPVRVGDATTWASVSAGESHTCAVQTDATLWCWGSNRLAQLGVGITVASSTAPVQVDTTTTWASVTTGNGHTCAVRTDGTLWCWGDSSSGQLGVGVLSYKALPTQVGTETTWAGVTAGYTFTCGLRTDGTLWCWGDNGYGQLGVSDKSKITPFQVDATTTWASVKSGFNSSCAVRTDGSLWCWGNNINGQLGDGTTTHRFAPTQLGAVTTTTNGFAVGNHSCAFPQGAGRVQSPTGRRPAGPGARADERRARQLRTVDSLLCWGNNTKGQLGDGTTTGRSIPAQVTLPG